MRCPRFISVSVFALFGNLWLAPWNVRSEAPDFARQILPILSDKCFVCHGPDTRNDKDLRLDSREAATKDLGGYHAIDPDQPGESEALKRLRDQEDPMPPVDADRQLTEEEKRLLEAWILEGGAYAKHWAFQKPDRSNQPHQEEMTQHGHPIDAFIARQLDARGFSFAPEAPKHVLARRAALTLTGLPPDPAQLSDYLNDESPGAYERWLDQLLKNPAYGEHQARFWLDAIRYGDTHGLHLDNRRGIYPYRDWVVRAFNDNLPFDDFITWQLAGDLLETPSMEQQVATGFVRMNPTTAEGGVIPAEFQAKNNFDRVETLGTVFLGMSMVCARCHTHKYDPIPQQEYYELMAFFNSTSENPLDGNAYVYGPVLQVPENQRAWKAWHEQQAQRDALLSAAVTTVPEDWTPEQGMGVWEADQWKLSKPQAVHAGPPSLETMDDLKADAHGFAAGSRSTLPSLDQAQWVRFELKTALQQTLWITFSGGPASQLYLDGNAVALEPNASPDLRHLALSLTLQKGDHELLIKMAGTEVLTERKVRIHSPWEGEETRWHELSPEKQLEGLADRQGPFVDHPQYQQARSLAHDMVMGKANFTTTLVATDLDKPRETRLLHRGEYDQPTGEALAPEVLSIMGELPKDAPRNRLGLAQWLTSEEHPLTARVLINQLWLRLFGGGLVRTPEDFGLQGQQPTHPELLDWLAVQFQESGWDLQHMIRLVMTSRTFRQDASWRSEVPDPENKLFARGPSYRLDAEVLRDMGLWASQMLDEHMGGEGVKPYQPAGMWSAMAHPASNTKKYERDLSQRVYRRSLYVYWKRTSPHPMMTLFDAPSREASCIRRSRTNTPLQSLGLLNENQRTEMARSMGRRLMAERLSDGERLDYLFTLLASRPAQDSEREACMRLLHDIRQRYRQTPEDVDALLGPEATVETPHASARLNHAAWTQVAATVMASDAAILLY